MRLITAIIPPATLEPLKDALTLFGVRGLTITQVHSTDPKSQRVQIYRGQHFISDLEPSLKVELVVPDEETEDLLRVIDKIAGNAEDRARLWTNPVQLLVRVRTSERGLDAL